MALKSPEYMQGFTDALVYISYVFEKHSDAFMNKGYLKKKETRLVVSIIDAALRRRETLADVGPNKMNLFIRKDRSADMKEK